MKMILPESLKYIGVDDKEIDLFESQYIVPNGMAYNSYLILDEKCAVMDTCDKRFSDLWLSNLEKALVGNTPDYLIVHHLEPDHSGSIEKFSAKYPNAKIICSIKAKAMLPQFADVNFDNVETKSEGDTLCLGKHTLSFIMAPMIHWPEVMVSFENTTGTLFSADGFGKFGTLDTDEDWACEARRYYFNIVGKYGAPVQTLLKKASNLDIKYICALHGPVLCGEMLENAIKLYDIWSSYLPEKQGVFIAVASIHGNTLEAATKMKDILEEKGCCVSIADISRADIAECVEDAFKYSTLLCMASSYDGGVFAPMSDFIHHLSSKAYQNRRVAFVENGSWAPSALRTMKSEFEKMKNISFAENSVTIKTRLTNENIKYLELLADEIK